MRLRSLDKYIKDKLQGYKPAYQEDLWKGIEEKLPPSRVPNGQGSWLMVAAAAVVILALVPFMMKVNKLADQNQQMAQAGNEAKAAEKQVSQNPALKNTEILTQDQENNTREQPATNDLAFKQDRNQLRADYAASNNTGGKKTSRHQFAINQLNTNGISHNAAKQPSVSEENTALLNGAQQQNTANTPMSSIAIAMHPLDNKLFAEIKAGKPGDGLSRYIDRGSNGKNAAWANWQSIFYPFWKNPAYTGSEGRYNVTADYRLDFVNTGNTLNSHNDFGFDMQLPVLGLNAGLYRSEDLTHFSSQITSGLTLSKAVLQKGSTSIKIGAAATVIKNSLFYSALNYPDQIDPLIGFWRATKEKDPIASTTAMGVNAGAWLSNPHIMAGIDVENINQPRLQHTSEAAPLPMTFRGTAGYRFSTGPYLQWLPMAVVTRQNDINQGSATLTCVYKNALMASVAYQNISPTSGRGNLLVYVGGDIKKKVRVFASYGYNTELEKVGVNQNFLHAGVKFHVI